MTLEALAPPTIAGGITVRTFTGATLAS
jgi:hypothetical protein